MTPAPWEGRFVVYRVYSTTRCLYIGQTRVFEARMAQHTLTADWRRDIARVRVTLHESRDEARAVESAAIHRERPLGNIHGRGPRATWNAQDYLDVIQTVDARVTKFSTPASHARHLDRLRGELRRRFPDAARAAS